MSGKWGGGGAFRLYVVRWAVAVENEKKRLLFVESLSSSSSFSALSLSRSPPLSQGHSPKGARNPCRHRLQERRREGLRLQQREQLSPSQQRHSSPTGPLRRSQRCCRAPSSSRRHRRRRRPWWRRELSEEVEEERRSRRRAREREKRDATKQQKREINSDAIHNFFPSCPPCPDRIETKSN